MSGRRLNPRLVKIHYSYTIEEAASLLGVHKNTIMQWRRQGLKPLDDRRPVLFHGSVLRTFLERRRKDRKQKCAEGELFCLRCRKPKRPANNDVALSRLHSGGGNLRGYCPDCHGLMCRRVSEAQIDAAA
jgi:excisionase family DNA binding protein